MTEEQLVALGARVSEGGSQVFIVKMESSMSRVDQTQ